MSSVALAKDEAADRFREYAVLVAVSLMSQKLLNMQLKEGTAHAGFRSGIYNGFHRT